MSNEKEKVKQEKKEIKKILETGTSNENPTNFDVVNPFVQTPPPEANQQTSQANEQNQNNMKKLENYVKNIVFQVGIFAIH